MKKLKNTNEWDDITIDVKSVDWGGNQILIQKVPAKCHAKTRKVLVSPKDVAKAEFDGIAQDLQIQGRDIMLFLLLYAKPGPFQKGYLSQKYKINKMLFYQWKDLEKEGFGEVMPRDDFEIKARGPVPKNLWDDLKRLKDAGLLKLDGGRDQKKTVTVELNNDGAKIAQKLWNRIPDIILGATTRIKYDFFLMSPKEIMEKVHKEYPDYKKTYKYLDKEEKLMI